MIKEGDIVSGWYVWASLPSGRIWAGFYTKEDMAMKAVDFCIENKLKFIKERVEGLEV